MIQIFCLVIATAFGKELLKPVLLIIWSTHDKAAKYNSPEEMLEKSKVTWEYI